MRYTLEILKDDIWHELEMGETRSVPYNILVSKIGGATTKKVKPLKHFQPAKDKKNMNALGLNVWNNSQLYEGMNTRRYCLIKQNGKIIRKGWLVVNNVKNTINVNIIDEALNLIDDWAEMGLTELLNSISLISNLPADYINAVSNAKTVLIDYLDQTWYDDLFQNNIGGTSSSDGLGYPLCSWPNNLNCIGDKFNNPRGNRLPVGTINPFQSRPLWNSKALLDIVCYAFGYTPSYQYVDTKQLKLSYITSKDKAFEKQILTKGIDSTSFYNDGANHAVYNAGENTTYWECVVKGSTDDFLRPNDLLNWNDPSGINYPADYYDQYCILKADTEYSWAGKWNIDYYVSSPTGTPYERRLKCKKILRRKSDNQIVSFDTFSGSGFPHEWTLNPEQGYKFTVEKSTFSSTEYDYIGLMIVTQVKAPDDRTSTQIFGSIDDSSESYSDDLPMIVDEYQQIAHGQTANITHHTPNKSLKEIVSAILMQQGLLMWVDGETKKVVFFTYGLYTQRMEAGDFHDWSKYYRRAEEDELDTNFKNFGRVNRISLQSPFEGNYHDVNIDLGEDSKFLDFIEAPTKSLKDVKGVTPLNVQNPFYKAEYELNDFGMVEGVIQVGGEFSGNIADNFQTGIEQVLNSYGIDAGVIANYNYLKLPIGVKMWYSAISNGVRKKEKFLIPQKELINFDLTKPIYVDQLGGFHILEQIGEYRNGQTLCEVTLIKTEINDIIEEGDISEVTVTMTHPTEGQQFLQGDTVNIAADVDVSGGWLVSRDYYEGTTHLGTHPAGQFYFTKDDFSIGVHSIHCVAIDSNGQDGTSDPVTFEILDPALTPVVMNLSSLGISLIYHPWEDKYYLDGTLISDEIYWYGYESSGIPIPSQNKYENGNLIDGDWFVEIDGYFRFSGTPQIGKVYNMVELVNYVAPSGEVRQATGYGVDLVYVPSVDKFYVDGTVTNEGDGSGSESINNLEQYGFPAPPTQQTFEDGVATTGKWGIYWFPTYNSFGIFGRVAVLGTVYNMVELISIPD